jgi:hypothetical protein
MPTLKAIVGRIWITDEIAIVNSFEGWRTQPTSFLSIEVFQGDLGVQHFSIGIEDALEVIVNFRNAEEKFSMFTIQKINKDGKEGDSDDFCVLEPGRSEADGC